MSPISSPISDPPPDTGPSAWASFQKSIRPVLRPIASLQLTVFLFVLSLLLVFFGTMAQINSGLWSVMHDYFRSWVVEVPFQLFAEFGKVFFDLNKETEWKGSFYFPSGNTLGFALLANLLAAHLIRFRMTWKRSGIFLIHAGIIILMLGEYFTGRYAYESRMVLQIGETSDFVDHHRLVELVVTQPTNSKQAKAFTIPNWMFEDPGWIRDDRLPVDIRVDQYFKNTSQKETLEGDDSEVVFDTNGNRYKIVPASEEPGVRSKHEDAPAVRIELFRKGTNETLGKFFLSLWQYRNFTDAQRSLISMPHTFDLDGATCSIEIRNRRILKPYNIELLKFKHSEFYSENRSKRQPKEYASTVRLRDPQTTEDREVGIWMNHPLRYQGMTFYQSGFIGDDSGTILQAVDNPVWILPYISCVVVAIGMIIHFGLALAQFQRRRFAV
jgi:hypothetical protein